MDAALPKRRMKPRQVDAAHGGDIAARPAHRPSFCVRKARAERREHAQPAIVRRAAADADDELVAAALDRGEHELSQSIRRRAARVALLFRHERQAGRIRHLDDRRLLRRQKAEAAIDRPLQRPRDRKAHDLARKACDERIDRALAAVRQREDLHFGLGEHLSCRTRRCLAGCP